MTVLDELKKCNWNWEKLSKIIKLTPEILKLDYPWTWDRWGISSNPTLTLDILERFDWDWGKGGISCNPALTLEILERFEGKSFRIIEEKWIECRDNPKYEMCFNMTIRNDDDDYTFEEWKKDIKK